VVVAASFRFYLIGSRETLTQLLAGLGLVGLAASLAAQDTLKNLFGTLLLIGEHPFRIGEHVAVQGVEGTIESVGFRSTRLRTFEDSLLTIPNSVMAAAMIDKPGCQDLSTLPHRRVLPYGTPIDKLVAMRDALRAFAVGHSRFLSDKIEVHIGGLGASSVELFVQVYFRGGDPLPTSWPAATNSAGKSSRRPGDWASELAFPAQTIHRVTAGAESRPVPPEPKHLGRGRPEASLHGHGRGDGHARGGASGDRPGA